MEIEFLKKMCISIGRRLAVLCAVMIISLCGCSSAGSAEQNAFESIKKHIETEWKYSKYENEMDGCVSTDDASFEVWMVNDYKQLYVVKNGNINVVDKYNNDGEYWTKSGIVSWDSSPVSGHIYSLLGNFTIKNINVTAEELRCHVNNEHMTKIKVWMLKQYVNEDVDTVLIHSGDKNYAVAIYPDGFVYEEFTFSEEKDELIYVGGEAFDSYADLAFYASLANGYLALGNE